MGFFVCSYDAQGAVAGPAARGGLDSEPDSSRPTFEQALGCVASSRIGGPGIRVAPNKKPAGCPAGFLLGEKGFAQRLVRRAT